MVGTLSEILRKNKNKKIRYLDYKTELKKAILSFLPNNTNYENFNNLFC